MRKELLGLSQCLATHPLLAERPVNKIKYINILEYFVNRFSKNNVLADATLALYKQVLLKDVFGANNVEFAGKATKNATGLKAKGLNLFAYRYILLFDCFFINAFDDIKIATKINQEIKKFFHIRYHKKFDTLFSILYEMKSNREFKDLSEQIDCWKMNKAYLSAPIRKILITANMSAGKSTLINALVGKKINKTQNDACTAKIHYVFNKPIEDGYTSEFDYQLDMNADFEALMQDNPENLDMEISVGTYFRTTVTPKERICIIDTPGVNNALDKTHQDLSYACIDNGDYDIVVCVLNASNIGTVDERNHLQHIAEIAKHKQTVFVINQLDKFDKEEDSIEDCIVNIQQDLQGLGLKNASICPISAYAGLLAKKHLYGVPMSDVEMLELQMFILKFRENYVSMKKYFSAMKEEALETDPEDSLNSKCLTLLKHAGFTNLEKILFE